MSNNINEQKFYQALEDIFSGANIEGEGGYVNLLKIKRNYYKKVLKQFKQDLEKEFEKLSKLGNQIGKSLATGSFKEELFDKLYSFFKRYFSESGSVYYVYTPAWQKIYERVYDDKDVALFWKTHMLYYVKSDVLFKNMEVEVEDEKFGIYNFYFDVLNLEHKKNNEKKDIVFFYKETKEEKFEDDNNVYTKKVYIFDVKYKEGNKQGDTPENLSKKLKIPEQIIEKAFKTFRKQSEVDFFINKNAKKFLLEQLHLYLNDILLHEENKFDQGRLQQLRTIQIMAEKIIDFIGQFEDELVRIWNKPKFVLNSNYVITLDRIAEKDFNVVEKIVEFLKDQEKEFKEKIREYKEFKNKKISEIDWKNVNNQLIEWYLHSFVDEDFELKKVFKNTLNGVELDEKYKFLPIDTKYLNDDLKYEVLGLFDNLDDNLDGILIKSENYQALNTILPKFKEKIQTIYIDPPFNLGQNADFYYNVNYKDSTWATLLHNRLELAKELLNEKGSIFVRCDYNGNHYIRFLMDNIFEKENFRNEIVISKTRAKQKVESQFIQQTESLFFYSKGSTVLLKEVERERQPEWHPLLHFPRSDDKPRIIFGKEYYPPKGRRWALSQDRIEKFEKAGKIRINESLSYVDCRGNVIRGVPELLYDTEIVGNEWLDIPGYSQAQHFPTENSEQILKRVIQSTSNEREWVLDFFLGSGTTTAVAHKLRRKWIGIEMGEHFYTVILPRMKKVLFYDKSGISKDKDVKEKYNEKTAGGFFKYYELEQYEDTLKKIKYSSDIPTDIFDVENPYAGYIFFADEKFAYVIKDKDGNLKLDFESLYPNIDWAEIISNLTGLKIKKVLSGKVILYDGTEEDKTVRFDFENMTEEEKLEFLQLIKSLIWWGEGDF